MQLAALISDCASLFCFGKPSPVHKPGSQQVAEATGTPSGDHPSMLLLYFVFASVYV